MKTKFNLIFLVLLLLNVSVLSVNAQDALNETLATQVVVFEGNQTLNSNQLWQTVGNFTIDPKILVSANVNTKYKWRFHLFYSVEEKQTDFAVQVRMRFNETQSPTFTLNWDEGKAGMRSAYTNWLRPDFLSGTDSIPVTVNVKTNQAEQAIQLQLVELEVWQETDNTLDKINVKQAIAPTLIKPEVKSTEPPKKLEGNPVDLVRETGLAFLQAAANNNVDAMQSLMATEVVSLSTLQALPTTDLPVLKLAKGQSFNNYLENYDPTIYSYTDFEGLFDDWDSHFAQGWQVSSKSYLFIGNQLKPWGNDLFADQPLVFVVEEENGVMKVKAFP